MKKLWFALIPALMLSLLMCGTALADTITVQAGETLTELSAGQEAVNYGTIITNNGTVTMNYGTININRGTVRTSETNGQILFNSNYVEVNAGYVETNGGTIDWNYGSIRENTGDGTISINLSSVTYNYGTIATNGASNNASAVVTRNHGTVQNNKAIIDVNYKTVNMNESDGVVTFNNKNAIVNHNLGRVNNSGGIINNMGRVYNLGGTITGTNAGTEYFEIEIIVWNGNDLESTHAAYSYDGMVIVSGYDGLWLGQTAGVQATGTITVTPDTGYEIKSFPGLPDNVSAQKNADGTWTLTVTSGVETNIYVPEATLKEYTLTIVNGAGGGEYTEGTSVTVTANAPEAGKRFKVWTGTDGLTFASGSAGTATATFPMPARDVNLTATYEDIPCHTVTVHDGYGSGEYAEGASVTIRAYNPAYGEKFKEWTGAEGLSFTSGSAAAFTATFIMPAHAVELTAAYEEALTPVYTLELPECVVVTPNAESTAVTAEVTQLSMVTGEDGKTPRCLRLIFNGLTLTKQGDSGKTIPCKLRKSASDTPTNQKMFNFYETGSCGLEVVIPSATWDAPVPGIYAGSIEYIARWLYSDNTWSGNVESGTIPVTLTIPEPVPEYSVTVNDGTGSGEYEEGASVTITANGPETGKQFAGWTWTGVDDLTFTEGSSTTATATFVMPASAVTLTATYANTSVVYIKVWPAGETFSITAEPDDSVDSVKAKIQDKTGILPDRQMLYYHNRKLIDGTRLVDYGFNYDDFLILYEIPTFGTPDFTLPANISAIEESAFEGIAETIVDIPEDCLSIGDYAFKDCLSLTQIRIPAGCELGVDVFDGCTLVYVFGVASSQAEDYCDAHENCVFVAEE